MKPTITVEGKQYPIVYIVVEMEGGIQRQYYNAETHPFMDDKLDFEKALSNPTEKRLYIERINNRINETREYLKDLKVQVANIVIENFDLPYPDIALAPIIEEIKSTVSYIEGLESALEVLEGGE